MTAPEARYQLLREVGRGSYGVVFEARTSATGARVAVKRMPCAAPETAELALHEFRALCDVRGQHAHLVRLEEAVLQRSRPNRPAAPADFQPLVEHEEQRRQERHHLELVESCLKGRPCCPPEPGWTCAMWFVMEYCDGGSLNDYLLGRGGPDPALNRLFMEQLASAAAFLHRSQIVHRDLKPDNVLVSCGPQGPQLKGLRTSPLDLSGVLQDVFSCITPSTSGFPLPWSAASKEEVVQLLAPIWRDYLHLIGYFSHMFCDKSWTWLSLLGNSLFFPSDVSWTRVD
ncbi:serine/threonine-protein kinase pdik1l-like isoform X2 [Ambystoma mexicanum]|uniref:serine/threonine-protein kinase pdik1l-like isoform X2 n=1 Tax=Ambystoma mexicanum TaxID=8296 RepID=UPI0037E89E03